MLLFRRMASTVRTEAPLGIHKARTAGLHDPATEAEEQRQQCKASAPGSPAHTVSLATMLSFAFQSHGDSGHSPHQSGLHASVFYPANGLLADERVGSFLLALVLMFACNSHL